MFLVLRISPKSRAKVCAQWRMSPGCSKAVILVYLLLFEVGVSCRSLYSVVRYLYVSCSGSIASVGEEIANLSAIVYS